MDFGGGDEIRFDRQGKAGIVTLTRPKALNAVTHGMIRALDKALDAWADDADIAVIVIKAEGRAFSAGGDIQHIYDAGKAGRPPIDFFADEYRLNAKIKRFKKPYVALIDGIVMGGGVGVSFHGSHRVMTENAIFAMPEVGIGFFPDVGGSHMLPRLKGSFGMYLGLTGTRIRRGDACWSGLSTHSIDAAQLPDLVDAIAESGLPDEALKTFAVSAERETDEAMTHVIQKHFSLGTLDDVLTSLAQAAPLEPFTAKTLETMKTRSPTSLHVAFRQITDGAMLSMDECMQLEFRVVNRMLHGDDFYEGIRAVVIDKDNRPRWRPATLEEVDPNDIDRYFAPLDEGELSL
ncbi:MAG TPA: enoyl-CoA hydratase/isomerase family protein [Rhizobiaceae bacterium]|nr:enoyl-CoA hydratase/isomerase family protein [Rhizobiaceae bacterium]